MTVIILEVHNKVVLILVAEAMFSWSALESKYGYLLMVVMMVEL